MRDAVLLLMLVGVALWSLRQPWVGVMAWTLTSLMSPHVQFGYAAASWPVAMVIALATLIGSVITKDKQNPFVGAAPKLLLALVVWVTATLPFSLFYDLSVPLWSRSIKIFLMILVTLALLTDRRKLDVYVWINVIAIGYYGVKGGLFTILTTGSYRVWGPGGFIEGNNELGLAVIMVIPLIRYLQLRAVQRWSRRLLGVAIGLCALMALGTHSRGALVGIAAMLALFWWRNRNKALWGGVIIAGGALALSFMPEVWWSRMQTMRTYDADDSALGRLNAWGMAINIANDRVTGGGFSMWTGVVFQKYGPEADRVHAAHSIYFQALGEQGWIGLLLFLSIGAATWLTARDLIKLSRTRADLKWAADLGSMVQVSMVGYAVAGAFLSLTWFDLPYNVMVMAVSARRLAQIDAALPAEQEKLLRSVANEAVQVPGASSLFKPTLRQ